VMSAVYPWKRYWVPTDGSVRLTAEGYLEDPGTEWGAALNPDAVQLPALDDVPCLVLLGEPGLGKSFTLRAEYEQRRREATTPVRLFDLARYESDQRLSDALTTAPEFKSWRSGTGSLFLLLDSLDECLFSVHTAGDVLVDLLRARPPDDLRIRVACRTAEWRSTLESQLREYFGPGNVGVYELLPLREADVRDAATEEGLEVSSFLSELQAKCAGPLAARPVTLRFLVNAFRKEGVLPGSQVDLFAQGCRQLCEEPGTRRRESGKLGDFSTDERVVVASRIAALMTLSGRSVVWTGPEDGSVPPEAITVAAIKGGDERQDDVGVTVTDACVREVLGTALFTTGGPDLAEWSHQTYQEYLAARYLISHDVLAEYGIRLLAHPADPESGLVPQLRGLAGWLAAMDEVLLRQIVSIDPEVFIRGDVVALGESSRARAVDALLEVHDERRILDWGMDSRRRYRSLCHQGLGVQLLSYLGDRGKRTDTRVFAVDLVDACGITELLDALAAIALDAQEPTALRKDAAMTVARIGDAALKRRLLPLVVGSDDDPSDGLKGIALDALWPDYMDVGGVLSVLDVPRRRRHYGAYRSFLSDGFVEGLSASDLPAALAWIEERAAETAWPNPFEGAMDGVLNSAAESLDEGGVLEAFAGAVVSRIDHHDMGFGRRARLPWEHVLDSPEDRRAVLDIALSKLRVPERDWVILAHNRTPLARSSDVPWMIEKLASERDIGRRDALAGLIAFCFDWANPQHLRLGRSARGLHKHLSERLPLGRLTLARFFPIALRLSDFVRTPRAFRAPSARKVKPSPTKRVAKLLRRSERGESIVWWRLNMEMTLEDSSTQYGSPYQMDLTASPGWIRASPETRARIVTAAEQFLLGHGSDPEKWLGRNRFYPVAAAGLRALLLLSTEDPPFLDGLPQDGWHRWTAAIVACTADPDLQDSERYVDVVLRAYQQAPDAVVDALMVSVDAELERSDSAYSVRRVAPCWDDRIAEVLLARASKENIGVGGLESLLEELLSRKHKAAETFALSLVSTPPSEEQEDWEKSLVPGKLLFVHGSVEAWQRLWDTIKANDKWGREVVERAALVLHHEEELRLAGLPEEGLADLFGWLLRRYPPREDPQYDGVHVVGPRDAVASLRGAALVFLKDRGTNNALIAVERIAAEFPDEEWLVRVKLEFEEEVRKRTWVPLEPRDLLALASDSERRLVRNADDLMRVVLESLGRLEKRLQGETPAATDLWSQLPGKRHRPKDENALSDYVKRHLTDDLKERGVVANREVEISRFPGTGMGKKTDLLVQALIRSGNRATFDNVSLVVEAKGCWNRELQTAMETQLLSDYMLGKSYDHGIYLVGWYCCDAWDDSDSRANQVFSGDVADVRQELEEQAERLSSRHGVYIRVHILDVRLPP